MTARMPSTIDALHQQLTDVFHPEELRIEDFSAEHAGHAGARNGGHYRVFIVAEQFTGRPLVARHRMVYQALADHLKRDVHALSIVAKAPAELPPPAAPQDTEPAADSE